MAITVENTNYNGEVISYLYKVLGVGMQAVEKGSAYVETGISTKKAIPRIQTSDDPIGDYETTPTGETADTDYIERELVMAKGMLYEVIDPVIWHDVWEEFKSQGVNFTNLALNPQIVMAVMDLYKNSVGRQMSREFWAGSTVGGDRIDGIVTKAAADADVIDVVNIGVITSANVFDVLQDVWDAIPDQFIDDPNYKIHMSTSDWRLAQAAHLAAKSSQVGYLESEIADLFISKRLVHYAGIPKDTVLAAKGTNGQDSNLIWGVYATPDSELGAPIIDKVANNSRSMFIRVDFKYDANYRAGSEIVLYQGV